MQSSVFIDDIFQEFFTLVLSRIDTRVLGADINPAYSFYELLSNSKPVTLAQSQYIIRLLTKYQHLALQENLDYSAELKNPQWRYPFRVIDQTKQIHVEKDEAGLHWICLKFPFPLKKEFDADIDRNVISNTSTWNDERKLRMLALYDYNLVHIYEFVKKHNFIIDDSFITALSEVEEIWSQEDDIQPRCSIVDDRVVLDNVSEGTIEWWNSHSTGILENDLLLAKSMCLKFIGTPRTLAEKIASVDGTHFWIRDQIQFLNLCKKIQGRVAIILDRAFDPKEWVKNLIADVEQSDFPKSDIKVCFRMSKDQDQGFNDWVKDNHLGGTVDQGKILIFDHKPAKWLFKQNEDVKLLVTNNLYPHTHALARDWFNCHPCVIYLGDIKPTLLKDRDIVEL